jgi:hypothetical protein
VEIWRKYLFSLVRYIFEEIKVVRFLLYDNTLTKLYLLLHFKPALDYHTKNIFILEPEMVVTALFTR